MSRDYFTDIRELVSPEIYDTLGDASWRLIPDVVKSSLNALREAIGCAITINDWHLGGEFRYSGIRPVDCPEGAKKSTHKLVFKPITSFDMKCKHMDRLIAEVKANHMFYRIIRIENPEKTRTWLHGEFSDIIVTTPLVVFDP